MAHAHAMCFCRSWWLVYDFLGAFFPNTSHTRHALLDLDALRQKVEPVKYNYTRTCCCVRCIACEVGDCHRGMFRDKPPKASIDSSAVAIALNAVAVECTMRSCGIQRH